MLGNIILWCNILFCPAYGIVCQQMIPYAKHTENIAQQSDLFVAVSIVCEQTNPYAEHTEIFVQQLDFFVAVSAVIRADIFVCWSHGKLCAAIVKHEKFAGGQKYIEMQKTVQQKNVDMQQNFIFAQKSFIFAQEFIFAQQSFIFAQHTEKCAGGRHWLQQGNLTATNKHNCCTKFSVWSAHEYVCSNDGTDCNKKI